MMMKQSDVILNILCQGHCGKGLVSIAKALRFPPQQPCNIDHVSKAFKKMSHFICLLLFTTNFDPLKSCFFSPTHLIVFRICNDGNWDHTMKFYYIITLLEMLMLRHGTFHAQFFSIFFFFYI